MCCNYWKVIQCWTDTKTATFSVLMTENMSYNIMLWPTCQQVRPSWPHSTEPDWTEYLLTCLAMQIVLLIIKKQHCIMNWWRPWNLHSPVIFKRLLSFAKGEDVLLSYAIWHHIYIFFLNQFPSYSTFSFVLFFNNTFGLSFDYRI